MTLLKDRDEPKTLGDLTQREIEVIEILIKNKNGLRLIDIANILGMRKQSASEYVYRLAKFNIIIRKGNKYYAE